MPIRTVPVQTVPVQPKLRVTETPRAVVTPPAVHTSLAAQRTIAAPTTRVVSKPRSAAPSRRHDAQASQLRAKPRVQAEVHLLELLGGFGFPAARAAVDSGGAELKAVGHGGLALPAGLALLMLAVASGSFLSLVYRLRRDQVEV